MNYRPVLALSIILVGILISISVAFLDLLGPNVPLPRKSISEILKTSDNSTLLLAKENISAKSTRNSAELFLNQENLVHGYSKLIFNKNLSDPENGEFTFFTAVCYGSSGNDCNYLNTYLRSYDYGDTWKIGFLE
ncbi:MAG: hypothetical protein CMF99_00745 [Candidatus Marinimicrobia bacterium]|nr:hypothetical protein [Candidatus Neomarinimicrobiota bacterium]